MANTKNLALVTETLAKWVPDDAALPIGERAEDQGPIDGVLKLIELFGKLAAYARSVGMSPAEVDQRFRDSKAAADETMIAAQNGGLTNV